MTGAPLRVHRYRASASAAIAAGVGLDRMMG